MHELQPDRMLRGVLLIRRQIIFYSSAAGGRFSLKMGKLPCLS